MYAPPKNPLKDEDNVSLSLIERLFIFIGFSKLTSSILYVDFYSSYFIYTSHTFTHTHIRYAIVQILTSMIIVFIFADPLVNTMLEWAKWLGVPSVIPVMFIPIFTSGEVVSAYNWAQGGFKGKLSMTYTSLYSAVAMNNCLVFGAFLLMIYSNDLVWDFAGESIGLLVTSCVIGTLGSNFFTYTMLHGAFVMSLFPFLALVIYLFASSAAVRDAASTCSALSLLMLKREAREHHTHSFYFSLTHTHTHISGTQAELNDIENDGPLSDQAKPVWITFAVFAVASLCYTLYDITSEYLESRKKIQEQLRESGKETWGTIKNTVSATKTLKAMGQQRASRRRLRERKAHDTKLRRVLSQTMSRRSSSVDFRSPSITSFNVDTTKEDDVSLDSGVQIEMHPIGHADSVDTKALDTIKEDVDMSPVRKTWCCVNIVLFIYLTQHTHTHTHRYATSINLQTRNFARRSIGT